jgi:hypothetical protein
MYHAHHGEKNVPLSRQTFTNESSPRTVRETHLTKAKANPRIPSKKSTSVDFILEPAFLSHTESTEFTERFQKVSGNLLSGIQFCTMKSMKGCDTNAFPWFNIFLWGPGCRWNTNDLS